MPATGLAAAPDGATTADGSVMSIRLIALDLYRVWREIQALEKQLVRAPLSERPALEESLRLLRAEHTRLRQALDGAKD